MLPNTTVTVEGSKERSESPPQSGALPSTTTNRGWLTRILRAMGRGRSPGDEPPARNGLVGRLGAHPSGGEIRSMTQHLIAEDRYVFVLLDEAADVVEQAEASPAWKAMDEQMALIPG